MNPVNFEDMNCIFKAEGCGDLPALKTDKHIVSCWKMTEKEKKEFMKTEKIKATLMVILCFVFGFVVGCIAINHDLKNENTKLKDKIGELERTIDRRQAIIDEQYVELDSLRETVYMYELNGR